MKRLQHKRNERGQAVVEFALILPILVVVVFGGIDLGKVYFQWQQLSAATSEGARTAIVRRSSATRDQDVRDAVVAAAPGLDSAQLGSRIAISFLPRPAGCTADWQAGCPVTVTARFPTSVNIMGIEPWSGELTTSRTMRVEQ